MVKLKLNPDYSARLPVLRPNLLAMRNLSPYLYLVLISPADNILFSDRERINTSAGCLEDSNTL